jgi:hypothetical protein
LALTERKQSQTCRFPHCQYTVESSARGLRNSTCGHLRKRSGEVVLFTREEGHDGGANENSVFAAFWPTDHLFETVTGSIQPLEDGVLPK